jgi:uncharacterized FAD-dependent dehydrogenase
MKIEIAIPPRDINDEAKIKQAVVQKSKIAPEYIKAIKVLRRSVDARKKPIFRLHVEVIQDEDIAAEARILDGYKSVENAPEVIVVGAGPAGYFAALQLIEIGLKPIVLDRGKDVQQRRRDLRAIQQDGKVNPHSNYCFGEGGAGTYSDGKLYTRSHKRGNIQKSLQLLVEHGANTDILIDAHPHIGSNKLPKIVANIRATIEQYGGKVHFNTFVTDFIINENNGEKEIKGVVTSNNMEFIGESVILATGHSARDIFKLLDEKNIKIEAKPFALGIRIEHPQPLIDQIQYGQQHREDNLPASSYSLVSQEKGRGVFSFCMCPGGLVVPASTAPGELVVNGMSLSRRDSPFANSGMVVAVELEDMADYAEHGVFASMEFQKAIEQKMFNSGDGSQKAPAQRMTDFVNNKQSSSLNDTSYIPGLHSQKMTDLLPPFIGKRLQSAMQVFGKKLKGYYTEEANIIGIESRTSSPIRIPRAKATFMHEDVKGLFPCGEGAGYAGGILSAAMDGQNVAKAVGVFLDVSHD